jgi:hypothetical protein
MVDFCVGNWSDVYEWIDGNDCSGVGEEEVDIGRGWRDVIDKYEWRLDSGRCDNINYII